MGIAAVTAREIAVGNLRCLGPFARRGYIDLVTSLAGCWADKRHDSRVSVWNHWNITIGACLLSATNLDGVIRDGSHYMQVRVYFEDTDFSQIVYHANYLRFMERGRTNYLRLLGTDHRRLFESADDELSGFAFVVRSMKIDYFKPAYMDDVIDVITAPEEVKGASITLLQQCKRGDDLLVEAHVRVAFVSGGKAQRIPKYLRDAMEAGAKGAA